MTEEKGKIHSFSDFKAALKPQDVKPLAIPSPEEIMRQLAATGDPRAQGIIDELKREEAKKEGDHGNPDRS